MGVGIELIALVGFAVLAMLESRWLKVDQHWSVRWHLNWLSPLREEKGPKDPKGQKRLPDGRTAQRFVVVLTALWLASVVWSALHIWKSNPPFPLVATVQPVTALELSDEAAKLDANLRTLQAHAARLRQDVLSQELAEYVRRRDADREYLTQTGASGTYDVKQEALRRHDELAAKVQQLQAAQANTPTKQDVPSAQEFEALKRRVEDVSKQKGTP